MEYQSARSKHAQIKGVVTHKSDIKVSSSNIKNGFHNFKKYFCEYLFVKKKLFHLCHRKHFIGPRPEISDFQLSIIYFLAPTLPAPIIALWWGGRASVLSEQPRMARLQSGWIFVWHCFERLNLSIQKLLKVMVRSNLP